MEESGAVLAARLVLFAVEPNTPENHREAALSASDAILNFLDLVYPEGALNLDGMIRVGLE